MSTGLIDGAMDLLADHCVVETGTSGIWFYRKWSDGTAECWGGKYYTVSLNTVATYYHRGAISNVSFPSGLFTEAPLTQATATNNTYWITLQGVSKTAISTIHVYDVVNGTNVSVYASLYARGKWK